MARKKSMGLKVFFTVFKSFMVVMLMMAVGVASYKFTMKYYEVKSGTADEEDILDIVGDISAGEVSRNLIYSVNMDDSKIEGVVIEILNTLTGNLDYITVPIEYQITIDNEMYQRLYAAGVDVPQVMNVSQLNKFFKDDTSYEYGIILLEKALGVDIGYYTAMPKDKFDEIFVMDTGAGYYKLTDTIISEGAAIADVSEMQKYIKEKCEGYTTNIKAKSKAGYADSYKNIQSDYIYYHVIPGEMNAGVYEADANKTEKLYDRIINDVAHTIMQKDVKDVLSEGKSIKVLNGSGGDGIAAKVKGILEKDGYSVTKIADNPTLIEDTIIQVAEDGMGKDIKGYFENASIEVTQIEEGFDIIIIVGKSDAQISAE